MEYLYIVAKWAMAIGSGIILFILRKLYIKVDKSISREEAAELVSDKLAPISQRQDDIREDQREIKKDVSKILDRLSQR